MSGDDGGAISKSGVIPGLNSIRISGRAESEGEPLLDLLLSFSILRAFGFKLEAASSSATSSLSTFLKTFPPHPCSAKDDDDGSRGAMQVRPYE